VVHVLDYPPVDDLRELLQVHDVAGVVLDLPGDDDLEDVVVAVQVRALAEQTLVVFVGSIRVA
jgi:hypothetical protein